MNHQFNHHTTQSRTIEDELYVAGIYLLFLIPVCILLYLWLRVRLPIFRLPCLLHALTGYYCPGCGGTRAVYALLHLHPIRSFLYHPLVPYAAAVYGWFMLSQTIERLTHHRLRIGMRAHAGWLWGALGIVIVNVIVRNGALFFFDVDLFDLIPLLI